MKDCLHHPIRCGADSFMLFNLDYLQNVSVYFIFLPIHLESINYLLDCFVLLYLVKRMRYQ